MGEIEPTSAMSRAPLPPLILAEALLAIQCDNIVSVGERRIHGDNIAAEAAACIREMVEWRPIETAPRDGTIIQRPHTTWGAMSVRHKRPDQSEEFLRGFSWMSADYSVMWPESAFLPFWLPLPPAPGAEA